MKPFLRRFIPSIVRRFIWKSVQKLHTIQSLHRLRRYYGPLPIADTFADIYRKDIWGNGSGSGSDDRFATAYCDLVSEFARQNRIDGILDIGCGDFRVGKLIVSRGLRYLGVDVVQEVIERNQREYGSERVRFQCLDATLEKLPHAELCLIRQVLQHLSNDEIWRILQNCRDCKHILITEHVPLNPRALNIDKPHGPDTRIDFGRRSGVFLDASPFCLSIENVLEVPYTDGEVLRTVYISNAPKPGSFAPTAD
jgi:SAM-dependent methyltransferase